MAAVSTKEAKQLTQPEDEAIVVQQVNYKNGSAGLHCMGYCGVIKEDFAHSPQ